MSDPADALGGRLPLADPAALTAEQRALFDRMIARIVPWADEAGFASTAKDGRLIGPFNPALLNPAVTASILDLSVAERTHTSLSQRVREVVILTVGAVWRADYELYAHLALARTAGLSEQAARLIATGKDSNDLRESEKIAQRLTTALSTAHRVDDALYRQAEIAFGAQGLADIAYLIGIYHAVCAVLTLFSIPAPGQAPHS
ncbi:carboxymuconolactone decarboxylase family protein [Mycobacterium sp. CPCC 205372]|uniref:Carboxymuconolactone decarboxylase family protein n=1 Tax=Mycobacterium hippophais TaxID=3016340 RepID=A0ABT4PX11_9MYCO|nr:carboxymuconolactone decarboxylase family protein [Mycobacterium hippophais]MCZ8381127.1 carboxymuconolactone decarboxylase family protein [Mycobacterium hippophais]